MASYIGLSAQKTRNNIKSTILLILFPCLVLILTFCICLVLGWLMAYDEVEIGENVSVHNCISYTLEMFYTTIPWVIIGVLIWFTIAYFFNVQIIKTATQSKTLSRKENKRVYNLVENLCMSVGMQMPKVNVIEDSSLNAFASGINKKSYTVTLTRGIINKLDDKELEAVIAHELSHIRNNDVRTLIISIVFVGIFSAIASIAFRMLFYGRSSRSSNNGKSNSRIIVILLVLIFAIIGYFFTILMRFAISRQREYLADASAAEMTKNPWALASALRKISNDPIVECITREDVAQLFISHPKKKKKKFSFFTSLFATHPPIEKRIEFLEKL